MLSEMRFKNISKEAQLTYTVEGQKEVKAGEVFESDINVISNYPELFEEVNEPKKEEAVEKKTAKKSK